MPTADHDWEQLLALLAPIHDEARLVARRIARDVADGDDLFQEALLRAAARLQGLRDAGCFRVWFYRLLFNLHRSRARRSFWRRLLPLDERVAEAIPARTASGARDPGGAERAAAALAVLPAVQREAVILYELMEFSVEEIAELTGVTASAVKSRLARGRDRLRRHYQRAQSAREERSHARARVIG